MVDKSVHVGRLIYFCEKLSDSSHLKEIVKSLISAWNINTINEFMIGGFFIEAIHNNDPINKLDAILIMSNYIEIFGTESV